MIELLSLVQPVKIDVLAVKDEMDGYYVWLTGPVD